MAYDPSLAATSEREPTGPPSTSSSRKLSSWIEGYVELTNGISSPEIFRRWSAVSAIAGALERKTWVRFNKRTLYPNLYILLIGGPGVGKTEAITGTGEFLRSLPDVHVAPTSVSRASVIDALVAAERTIVRPGDLRPVTTFNSLSVCAYELGTFLTAYEGEFMSTLNDLYDCKFYSERKRSLRKGEPLVMPEPQLNLIAGTTPGWLVSNLPAHAWNEGFTSRLFMVYGKERMLSDPWAEAETDRSLRAALEDDLLDIHAMFGQFRVEEHAMQTFSRWYLGGQEPVPTHPRLEHYIPRRPTHLLKLAMCLSASRASDYVIRLEDLELAMSMLFEIEQTAPLVFRDMSSGGDAPVMDELWEDINREFVKNQRPIPEYRIVFMISRRVPHYGVKKVLEIMVESNMLKHVSATGPGGRPIYAPVQQKDHNPPE